MILYNILGYISVCKASFALTLSALCRFPWVSHQRTTLPRFAQNNWIRYIVVAFLLYCSPETGTFFSNYLTFDLESTRVHYMWCRSANVHLEINFLTFQQELQCHFLFLLQTFVLFLLQTFIKLSKHKVIERARIINPNSPKMTFLAIDYPIATFWYIHMFYLSPKLIFWWPYTIPWRDKLRDFLISFLPYVGHNMPRGRGLIRTSFGHHQKANARYFCVYLSAFWWTQHLLDFDIFGDIWVNFLRTQLDFVGHSGLAGNIWVGILLEKSCLSTPV